MEFGADILPSNAYKNITFEIIQAYDEDFSLVDCIKSSHACSKSSDCTSRHLWQELSKELKGILQNMTLQELIERGRNSNIGAAEWVEYVI